MKTFGLLVLAFLLMSMMSDAVSQVRVRGYIRKNGTYVAPHYRSSPNSSKYDNYSSRGNYNPYTGEKGTAETIPSTTTYRPHVSYPAISSYAPSYRDRTYRPVYSTQPQGTYSSPASGAPTFYRSLGPGRVGVYQGGSLIRVLGRNAAPASAGLSSHGNLCTDDCSGHEAGYEWAEENEITDPDDCGGNSDSFIEGCQAYAEENQ